MPKEDNKLGKSIPPEYPEATAAPEKIAERAAAAPTPVERERLHFQALILANPNYFGNLEASPFKPVKMLGNIKTYEELVCVGLNPPYDRLEAVIQVKKETGYGGDICTPGSLEYVRFYVDLHDNGVWHDVGLTSVRVRDIPGDKPLCYAVKLDFHSLRKFCTTENIVKVRAILSWNVAPPANTPQFNPVYGNRLTVQVQIQPLLKIQLIDILKELELAKVKIPDPIGPIIKVLDPQIKIPVLPAEALNFSQKRVLYAKSNVPLHRSAFTEAKKFLAASASNSAVFAGGGQSPLLDLGLDASDIAELLGKIQIVTDGDTSFEELRCVGLKPECDLLEAVLTVKRSTGYSGALCTPGSTEYVAFWIDFADGAGFTYMGTATVKTHDLKTIPEEGVQYAVFLKTDLSKRVVPCTAGPRVARLRAILSWEAAPPPGNPNYVPVWGNREECRVQLRPGLLQGRIPVIETVGDIGIDDIDPGTGLATGHGVIGGFSVSQSPFGGEVTLTGRIGNPPNSFNGGPPPLKYRIQVRKDDGVDTWHPLTNTIAIKVTKFSGGVQLEESPGDPLFDVNLLAADDSDGLGAGWYEYLEDPTGPDTRYVVADVLAKWQTTAAMEGEWLIRIDAKDPSTGPPTFYPGVQTIRVRIDNTAPSATLAITDAVFDGVHLPPLACGKYPKGTVLSGTYEVHDVGNPAVVPLPDQHFGSVSLDVIPDGPAGGALVIPANPYTVSGTTTSRSFPVVPTTGEVGTWELDTRDMAACGYVIRITSCDRTNYDSRGYALCATFDVGFCLEDAPKETEQ